MPLKVDRFSTDLSTAPYELLFSGWASAPSVLDSVEVSKELRLIDLAAIQDNESSSWGVAGLFLNLT